MNATVLQSLLLNHGLRTLKNSFQSYLTNVIVVHITFLLDVIFNSFGGVWFEQWVDTLAADAVLTGVP